MKYGIEYYEGMLRNYSKSAEGICKIRWDFIKEIRPRCVLDYGSGVGWFRAYRPEGVKVDSYDIAGYTQTGVNHDRYDVVCFWDVLEHIPDFDEIKDVFEKTDYIAFSMPIKSEKVRYDKWKHFKPGEHLHYFDVELLDTLFEYYGFTRVKKETPECPPRVDVVSFLYKRI